MKIGAHMSVAGGVSLAVDRAALHGCEALQVFSKNANRWLAPPLNPAEVRRFRARLDETGIDPAVSHASYLINLATADAALRTQSIDALADELQRADALGLLGVVLHPGACTSGTEDEALRLASDGLRHALRQSKTRRPMVLIEHTAGQGRTIGYRFEHLAALLRGVNGSPRVGVCLDTCHLVTSGYDIVTDAGYDATWREFDRLVGFSRLRVVHANDSKRPCGSRVDRHEHIGRGCLGLVPFWRMLHDPRFSDRPMLIETEKTAATWRPSAVQLDPLDVANLETLRGLRAAAVPPLNSDGAAGL
jgi:deoxyribonuclease-4